MLVGLLRTGSNAVSTRMPSGLVVAVWLPCGSYSKLVTRPNASVVLVRWFLASYWWRVVWPASSVSSSGMPRGLKRVVALLPLGWLTVVCTLVPP
ncbi:hypothetical protein D9M68_942390 [compost metagenome]